MSNLFVLSHFVVLLFALFLVFSGFLMYFKPENVRTIISKAGSTYLINYTELAIRLFIGIAFYTVSLFSIYQLFFSVFGYFLIVSALLLMFVPIKTHNQFSRKASAFLKPNYLKFVAPISIIFGLLLLLIICKQIQSLINLH